jgi:pimeloyl-ACP methyl ester carboxylesterase
MSTNPLTSINLYKEVYGAGDPMLCLHGLGANLYSWRHFVTPFSKDRKLVLVDFKGSGKSPKPHDSHYSIEDKTNEIYQLILEENLSNLTLVGNSLGGGIALLVALRLLEEQPGRLAKLILIDSAADKRYVPAHLKLIRSKLGPLLVYCLPGKLVARITLKFCYYDASKVTREQVAAYAQPLTSPGARHALLETARQCIPENADELMAKLSSVTVPTLLLWGRQDKVIPLVVGEILDAALPNSTLEIVEECGHVPQEEKPDETIERITRFLTATG